VADFLTAVLTRPQGFGFAGPLLPRILELLKESNAEDIAVILGGTIPPGDIESLKRLGIAGVYPTDTDTSEAIALLNSLPARN
jgi:methylmalonyl-CoA mutase C-terminal domain/subunit